MKELRTLMAGTALAAGTTLGSLGLVEPASAASVPEWDHVEGWTSDSGMVGDIYWSSNRAASGSSSWSTRPAPPTRSPTPTSPAVPDRPRSGGSHLPGAVGGGTGEW